MIVKIVKQIEFEGRKIKKDSIVNMLSKYAVDLVKQKKAIELDRNGNEVKITKNK